MAFKLTKDENQKRDSLVGELRAAQGKLEDAISVYNGEVTKLREAVEKEVEAYNEIVTEARGFAEDIANQADADISDKSERWQEGDKGQAAIEWKDAWEQLSLDDLEVEFPEELAVEAPNHAETLEDAPEAAEG